MRQSTKRYYKKLYRFRWFHSKGAAIVLTWISLVTAAHYLFPLFVKPPFYGEKDSVHLFRGISIVIILSAPFFGWLADAKLGNYRVLRVGLIAAFMSSALNSAYCLLYYNTSIRDGNFAAVKSIFLIGVTILYWIGGVITIMNSIQLGFEQLPDGSADNIASLISWMIFALFFGMWIGHVIESMSFVCAFNNSLLYQILMLLPAVFTSAALSLYYILSPKWLIIEPKTPQSLKNIFGVLKFAVKHKVPLNRSALTYWEEDVPSRLDLGKSRFGGPFTTEQVEDVKTLFRLMAVSVPLFLTIAASRLYGSHFPPSDSIVLPGLSACKSTALGLFLFDHWWCAMVAIAVYELVVYPFFNYRLPRLMKRIGLAIFIIVLQSILYLVVNTLDYFSDIDEKAEWLTILNSVLEGVQLAALFQPTLEFMCAQSPYNMRGLLTGYFILFYIPGISDSLDHFWSEYCINVYCPLIITSIAAVLNILAFLMYLIIASWYKMRVRDNEYPQHAVVEEVYDRYLAAQNTSQLCTQSH